MVGAFLPPFSKFLVGSREGSEMVDPGGDGVVTRILCSQELRVSGASGGGAMGRGWGH